MSLRIDRNRRRYQLNTKAHSMERTVADDAAEVLAASGIEKFFMLTGGDQPLWIALKRCGINMVVARSEASAVYMADGYARASGRSSVVYGQAGPGAANVAAAMADPYWAQSPVMALTGSTASSLRHVNEYQDLDHFTMFQPVTGWNARAEHPDQVAGLVRQGLRRTVAGTPVPVHLDIPKDFFAKPSAGFQRPKTQVMAQPFTMAGEVRVLERMAEILERAQRPMILVGEGVRFAKAWDVLDRFAMEAGIPMAATMGGKPAVRSSHPNFVGVVGRYSSVAANQMLESADAVLVLGSRLGGLATRGYTIPSRSATVMQIDRDASAFANPYDPEWCVQADIESAVNVMRGFFQQPVKGEWLASCQAMTSAWRERVATAMEAPDKPGAASPLALVSALSRYAGDVTLVADTGYMAAWTGVLFPLSRYDGYFRATGSLGWALPAALGVQMARGGKTVCVTGDGGAGYHLADIETAVRYRLPVIIVILNNNCLAFEYHEQKYRWQGRVVEEANNFTPVRYAAAAEALGARSARVDSKGEIQRALDAAMESDRPMVIEVVTDVEAFPPVTNFDAVMERKI